MGILAWAKGVWNALLGRTDIEKALNIKIIRNTELESDQELWKQMLEGKAPWNTKEVPSLHLASSICREISNNTTFELEADLKGSEELKRHFLAAVELMPEIASGLSGSGSLVIKPFVRGDKISISIATPDRFFPLKYNEIGDLISVAFADSMNTAEDYNTLLEMHAWDELTNGYRIEYRAFHSRDSSNIGTAIPITNVPAWAHLQDIEWQNIMQPLFIEINMPDKRSIFAKAVELIRLADEQYGRAVWEYEGGELAIDATIDLFRKDASGNPILPIGKKRLFRSHDGVGENKLMDTFAPIFRDTSLFNGLNNHKREIEFACGLSYSIISDPNNQDRTATEIRAAKHRFLVTIRTIQRIIEEAYRHLVDSMDVLGQLYGLFPAMSYEVSMAFDDAVLNDPVEDYTQRKELLAMGIISPAELRAWYFGESIEKAQENLPAQQTESIE